MKGDGNFLWFYGPGSQPDTFAGEHSSRGEALAAALSDYPDGDFLIVEADRCLPDYDVLPADWILERYEECNEECWSEDGAEINPRPEQERELEKELAATLQRWMEKHDLRGRLWSFGEMRNEEYFPLKVTA